MVQPDAPAQAHVGPDYISRTPIDIDVPNAVTAILGSYRGFDTLGETAVVFTAGIGVLLLLSGLRRRREDEDDESMIFHHLILRVDYQTLGWNYNAICAICSVSW